MIQIERINPTVVHMPVGWSHVVKATYSTSVYVSGMTGRTMDGRFLSGLQAQAEQAYENLRLALAAAGAYPGNVLKEVLYIVDYSEESGSLVWPARSRCWGHQLPASTVIGVQALAHPDALIEVEAIAGLD